MALHSALGFFFAFIGPLAFGWVLDLAGGGSPLAWGLAYASMGVVMVLGALALVAMNPAELTGDRTSAS